MHADVAELQELRGSLDLMHSTQKDILSMQNQCFRKIGFVKYNAFDNIGNNLSFAFTILDGKNDGFCLSSVYGRNESRIFAKPIIDGKCLYSMSEEEKKALPMHYVIPERSARYKRDRKAIFWTLRIRWYSSLKPQSLAGSK